MSTLNKVIKNSSIYGIVSVLQKSIGFFLLPIYTSYLTPKDYGITAVVGSIVSFLSVFYMLSLNASISRFYFDYNDDEEKLKEFWGTNILFVIINSIIMSCVLILFHRFLIQPFAKGIEFYPYVLLGIISITLNPVYSIFQSTLQVQQNGKKYGINNFLYFLINLILTIFMVVFLKLQAKGVLLASSLTDIIFFIYTIINFLPKVKLTINKEFLKQSISYSFPLIPHSVAGWTMSMIDRLFLNTIKTTETVGLYNIGFQFGNILNILSTAVNQAYVPWFYEKMGEGEKGKESIIKFCEYAVVGYGFIAMCISLFTEDVLNLMVSKNFREGWMVVPFIAFAYVFNGIYYFFANPLFYNKKGTKYIVIGTVSSAIMNIIFNLLLVPQYGMIGSSLASTISSFVVSILILYISIKIEKINFKYLKIYFITFVFFILSMVSFLKTQMNIYTFFIVKLLIIVFVFMFIFYKYKNECIKLYEKIICFKKH